MALDQPTDQTPRDLAPGIGIAALSVAGIAASDGLVTAVPPLAAAVAVGAVLANAGLVSDRLAPGLQFCARQVLRIGVVLLGFQLAIGDVLEVGAGGLAAVVAVVVLTFFGARLAGARLQVSPRLSLLVAAGFSICGASAIAAVEGVAEADEEEVAFAIGLVTLCGSLAIVILPLLADPLGLQGEAYGSWIGASVQDVAQVVAAASIGGAESLQAAVVVKLMRVGFLAPMVAGLAIAQRSRERRAAGSTVRRVAPMLPLFVVGFLAAVALRSVGIVSDATAHDIEPVQRVALSLALVGLGSGIRVQKLRRIGGRPVVLGVVTWLLVTSTALAGVALVR